MKKNLSKAVASLLAVTLCFGSVNINAIANENTDVSGNNICVSSSNALVTTREYVDENTKVVFTLSNSWDTGYNANVRIYNTGDSKIEDWYLSADYSDTISNIWNAEIYSHEDNSYVIKNANWNQDIAVGGYVEFGLSVNKAFEGCPDNFEVIGEIAETDDSTYSVAYKVECDWNSGFSASLNITNNSEETIEDWVLEFDYDREITNLWNGVITEHNGNHYVIKNADWNSNIAPKGNITIGFNGKDGSAADEPKNYVLSSNSLYSGDVEITINTDAFSKNEDMDLYLISDKVDSLSGTLSGVKSVKSLNYEVSDINGTIVNNGSVNVSENWTVDDIGFSVGYNKLTFTITKKNAQKETVSYEFLNANFDNMANTNVDLNDSDGDGLNNYYESIIGTDSNKIDTDNDGLTDYYEFLYTGTDPKLKDTDSNGTDDGDEDLDNDGLSNLKEIESGTHCYEEDTDGDELTDGSEVNDYLTNPLAWDTDGDGLSDSQDIELNFDPNLIDTDNDGINDGDEKQYQSYKEEISDENKPGILSVEVGMECNGCLKDDAIIIDTYDIDMRSSDVVGMIGVPVNISVEEEFTTADITFTYDESLLGDTDENDLVMLWYDQENDNYVVLDSTVDTENNTVKYTTTHFSTYLIVDKTIWLDSMRKDLNYRETGNMVYYDIALVVDTSGSMYGGRISTAKTAINSFIDSMLDKDKIGLIKFTSTANVVQDLTNEKSKLKNTVSGLTASGGTDTNEGIKCGISLLDLSNSGNQKMIVLICDGDVNYASSTIINAQYKGIPIYCINVVSGNSSLLERIANETGGSYYYAATTNEIGKIVKNLTRETVGAIDTTDTDGDGLYDVYEINGMRLSNGTIVYTDPTKADTDGDGINDYDAMGGLPVTESIKIDGKTYTYVVNHSNVYSKKSPEFINVDGKPNADGKKYYGKMSYVPYTNSFYNDKYVKNVEKVSLSYLGETRTAKGAAREHNLFKDKKSSLKMLRRSWYYVLSVNTIQATKLLDTQAGECLNAYLTGAGGDCKGLTSDGTRKYIEIDDKIDNKVLNSANKEFKNNMEKVKVYLESTVNKYNTEAYISISPTTNWSGCSYNDCLGITYVRDNIGSLANIGMFGIFNKADAGITVHCTYDTIKDEYSIDYKYYIIDFYDFQLYEELRDLNLLGYAKSYELYGYETGSGIWNKGKQICLRGDLR